MLLPAFSAPRGADRDPPPLHCPLHREIYSRDIPCAHALESTHDSRFYIRNRPTVRRFKTAGRIGHPVSTLSNRSERFDKSFSARGSRWRWREDDPSRMKNQSGDIKIGRHFVIFTADHDSLRLAYDRICVCIYVQGETSSGGQTRFPNAYAIPPLNVLRHRVIIILLSPIVNDRASEGNNMR